LHGVAAVEQVPSVQTEFLRQVPGRRALRNAAQNLDDDPTGPAGLAEEGAGEQVEDGATRAAAVDRALAVLAPLVRRLSGGHGMALGTGQPGRVKDIPQEVIATLFVQQRGEVEKHHRGTSGSRLTRSGQRRSGETPRQLACLSPLSPLEPRKPCPAISGVTGKAKEADGLARLSYLGI
jgi:hypothetical protein